MSQIIGRVAVIDQRGARPSVAHELDLQGGNPAGEALTHNGRCLLVARGAGAAVLDVARAERGSPKALLGDVDVSASSGADVESAIEVAVAPGNRYAFVSLEYADEIAVFDLRRALESRFRGQSLVGTIPLGPGVVGLAISPDGRWLYATSEVRTPAARRGGTLSVIDLRRAETQPVHAGFASVAAGCDPVRVATSPSGDVVRITARESNALLGFSASRLRDAPSPP